MLLTKGIYGSEFSGKTGPLGMRCGQMRPNKGLRGNAGWYNHKGEKLGFGDISLSDLERIRKEIPAGEMFVIMGESDSYWNFYYSVGSHGTEGLDEHNPGIDYVADKAVYAVTNEDLFLVTNSESHQNGMTVLKRADLKAKMQQLSRDTADAK